MRASLMAMTMPLVMIRFINGRGFVMTRHVQAGWEHTDMTAALHDAAIAIAERDGIDVAIARLQWLAKKMEAEAETSEGYSAEQTRRMR